MQMTFRWYGEGNDRIKLSDIKQIPGVKGIVWALHDKMPGEVWEEAEIAEIKRQCNEYGRNFLQRGTAWSELTLENVRFTDLKLAAVPFSEENTPLQIILKDVSWTFHESVEEKNLIWLREDSNAVVIEK